MMIEQLTRLKSLGNWEQVRTEFGAMINLNGPAPSDVVRRALEDHRYASSLFITSQAPSIQRKLLDGVNNGWAKSDDQPKHEHHSNMQLIGKAAASLTRWGLSGFTKLDEGIADRRWEACMACPNLLPAPERLIYKGLKIVTGDETRICGKCGCNAKRKTTLSTERCPDPNLNDPAESRWGESIA